MKSRRTMGFGFVQWHSQLTVQLSGRPPTTPAACSLYTSTRSSVGEPPSPQRSLARAAAHDLSGGRRGGIRGACALTRAKKAALGTTMRGNLRAHALSWQPHSPLRVQRACTAQTRASVGEQQNGEKTCVGLRPTPSSVSALSAQQVPPACPTAAAQRPRACQNRVKAEARTTRTRGGPALKDRPHGPAVRRRRQQV